MCITCFPNVRELTTDPELNIYWSTYLQNHPNEQIFALHRHVKVLQWRKFTFEELNQKLWKNFSRKGYYPDYELIESDK